MTVIQIGLVDKTGKLDPQLVQSVAAALNVQVTRDLPQFWPVAATVIYLSNPHKVPSGVWPVQLVTTLPPHEGGFHLNQHNQPYAKVLATPGSDGWTVAASHETIEMLVDPSGNRLQSSRSIEIIGDKIQDGSSEFEYLVEACDPCEADKYSYSVQGVVLSDFITPHYYDPQATPGTRYSYTGALTAPRQILPGGYISWIDPQSDEWQQLQFLNPDEPPVIKNLGPARAKSLREWIHTRVSTDAGLRDPRAISVQVENEPLFELNKRRRDHLDEIALGRSRTYL